jgi:pyruvate dehydrogenase E2 component (dihydrolipoamide acetyltransferase)
MPNITMPRLSDSMVDGTIVSWLRADGDELSVGDEFVEIETDKAIMPFQAEHAGTLKIVAREGESIAVGAVIGYIGDAGAGPEPEVATGGSVVAERTATAAVAAPPASRQAAGGGTTLVTQNGRVKASPLARRIAASLGVALEALSGSGPGGRIVKKDVQAAAGSQQQQPAAIPAGAPSRGSVERRPLTTTQGVIARRMVEAKATVPEFTVTVTVDMENTVALRAELVELEPDRKVSLGDFVVKACARALREHPVVNSSFVDGALERPSRVNIGVAVAAGAGGTNSLLVPTLYDADMKSVGQIGEETRGLAARARAGQLTPAEMSNATFTVSNLGMFGVSQFTAVINPPQAAILAVGAVEQQVVVHENGFVARRRMNMTLTADHRVIYGADAAAFLASVRDGLEHPLKLVI